MKEPQYTSYGNLDDEKSLSSIRLRLESKENHLPFDFGIKNITVITFIMTALL